MSRITASSKGVLKASRPSPGAVVSLHRADAIAEGIVLDIDDSGMLTIAANFSHDEGWLIHSKVAVRSSQPTLVCWSTKPPADPSIREPKEGDLVRYLTATSDRENPLLDSEEAVVLAVHDDMTIDLELSERSIYIARDGRIIDDLGVGLTTAGAVFHPHVETSVRLGVSARSWAWPETLGPEPLADPAKAIPDGLGFRMRSVAEQIALDMEAAAAVAAKESAEAARLESMWPRSDASSDPRVLFPRR